ncbi:hypothetical protein BurJ1DRAFT_1926 [Burkholderiales bacterium JOSHI_001]|nr:hypothetical protein BurJ1DRAFT_1926 [Burkholderiales bacterium JOSHI_001]
MPCALAAACRNFLVPFEPSVFSEVTRILLAVVALRCGLGMLVFAVPNV